MNKIPVASTDTIKNFHLMIDDAYHRLESQLNSKSLIKEFLPYVQADKRESLKEFLQSVPKEKLDSMLGRIKDCLKVIRRHAIGLVEQVGEAIEETGYVIDQEPFNSSLEAKCEDKKLKMFETLEKAEKANQRYSEILERFVAAFLEKQLKTGEIYIQVDPQQSYKLDECCEYFIDSSLEALDEVIKEFSEKVERIREIEKAIHEERIGLYREAYRIKILEERVFDGEYDKELIKMGFLDY